MPLSLHTFADGKVVEMKILGEIGDKKVVGIKILGEIAQNSPNCMLGLKTVEKA